MEYLEYLLKNTPSYLNSAFLLSAGTESTEAALKIMRMNAKKKKKLPGIISFEGNWHGRTMGRNLCVAMTPKKEWIGFEDPNMHRLPFPYPWKKEAQIDPYNFFLKSIKNLKNKKN